jgi:hypothetical protein
MLRRVALVRTDFSEEPSVSFSRVTRLGELGTTLAATSNRRTLRATRRNIQKTPFFIVTAVKTSNLTYRFSCRGCYFELGGRARRQSETRTRSTVEIRMLSSGI